MGNSEELSHLDAKLREVAWRSDDARVRHILRPMFIKHTAIQKILNEIQWMMSDCSHRAPGLVVCAPPGSGKTELSCHVNRVLPPREPTEAGLPAMPILVISMSGAYDMRTVYGRVLLAVDAPCPDRLSRTAREIEVLHLLHRLDCRLLVLDEFQDVLKGTEREQHRALDAVKMIMNDLTLPVLAMGTVEAGRALQSDAHLAARFEHAELPLWHKGAELVALLKAVHSQLPLRKPSSLTADDITDRILAHSQGVLGNIMRLIQDAAIHAIIEGQEFIDARMVDLAVARRPDASVLKPAA